MNDKDLLQQLKELKKVALCSEKKSSCKEVLFAQINSQSKLVAEGQKVVSWILNLRNILSLLSKPVLVVAGVFIFLLGSLIMTADWYKNTKPNDSLYIARIISEKAKLNTTFSQAQREELSLRFAINHAKDMAEILMDPDFNAEENKNKVEKMNLNFNNEISKVKTKIEKNPNIKNNLKIDSSRSEEDSLVYSASENNLNQEQGIDIYLATDKNQGEKKDKKDKREEEGEKNEGSEKKSSENEQLGKIEKPGLEEGKNDDSENSLEDSDSEKTSSKNSEAELKNNIIIEIKEIEQLSAEKKYEEVIERLNKLGEVDKKSK